MNADDIKCVLLADRHHGLSEGMRGSLETLFEAVVMVADAYDPIALDDLPAQAIIGPQIKVYESTPF
jgi:hypothetical protein